MFSSAQRLFLLICIFSAALFATSCISNKIEQICETKSARQNPTAININTASAEEFERLPGIGKELAQRIVTHREQHGKFRRVEHLILIKGLSDKKFREFNELVKAE